MLRPPLFLLAFAMVPFGGLGQHAQASYSKQAQPLWDSLAGSQRAVVVLSPDGKSRVTATEREDSNTHVDLNLNGASDSLHLDLEPGVGSEMLWSPDSKAFFVTSSDAGANGAYHLYVVDTFNGKLQSKEITELIYREFGHPVRCDPKNKFAEAPNVAGISWVGETHRLWVAAEIVNHSVCDSFGTFKAYEVDPSNMTIVRTLGQLEAKQEFQPLLGRELEVAPDRCIRNPRLCYVPENHPELQSK